MGRGPTKFIHEYVVRDTSIRWDDSTECKIESDLLYLILEQDTEAVLRGEKFQDNMTKFRIQYLVRFH